MSKRREKTLKESGQDGEERRRRNRIMKAEGADILMNQDARLGVYFMAWECRTNKMSLCINLKVDH